ncbi:MAG TPA: hypothetical protein VFQ67_11715 [Allosphingosinicella sp.]|jgi:hypothetical protein|nr:hypothetical protein [Allosphingosinicella sp.]
MNGWFLDPINGPEVAYIGFWLNVAGLVCTLIAFYLTYLQARKAATSAERARHAVEQFKFRTTLHDAARDLSEAAYALDITRRHLNNGSWRDAVDSYEDGRRAIIRVDIALPDLPQDRRDALTKMSDQMRLFCEKVDAAAAGKGQYPDQVKALAVIRKNYELLASLQRHLDEGVSHAD